MHTHQQLRATGSSVVHDHNLAFVMAQLVLDGIDDVAYVSIDYVRSVIRSHHVLHISRSGKADNIHRVAAAVKAVEDVSVSLLSSSTQSRHNWPPSSMLSVSLCMGQVVCS